MKFDICLMLSGIVNRVVEAESYEEAEKLAKDGVYNGDWNDLECVEIEIVDSEEVDD